MIQHASSYKILEKIWCLNGKYIVISDYADMRTRLSNNQPGKIVFRKNHILSNLSKGISSKFMPKYTKCRIKSKIGNCLYDTEDLKGKYVGRYHSSYIKP